MFVLAITLHNMPEGLAVGVGFGAADGMEGLGTALALMVAIGIQNIPEGLAVSVAAVNAGSSTGSPTRCSRALVLVRSRFRSRCSAPSLSR